MPDAPLLSVENVAVTFRNREGDHEVCSDVSFSVGSGEALAVIGESGSGKSVTVLSVAGLLGPGGTVNRGRIVYDGTDIARLSQRERRRRRLLGKEIGMIFQNPSLALDPVFTIGRQLEEALAHSGVRPGAQMQEKALDWLRQVGLPDPEEQLSRYPHQLSGGQKQRAMIAIALASNPRLLLADEPTTALDVTIQVQVLRLIRRLQQELQLALVIVTHDFGVVAAIADKVAVMYAGEVVETGTTRQVIEDPRHPYTKALLASLPTGKRGTPMYSLPGSVPVAGQMPSGCRFHPRCPIVTEECRRTHPVLRPVGDGRTLRSLCVERAAA